MIPRVEPVKVPLQDPEARDKVLRWLRSKNPEVDPDGNPILSPRSVPEEVGEGDDEQATFEGPYQGGPAPEALEDDLHFFDAEEGSEEAQNQAQELVAALEAPWQTAVLPSAPADPGPVQQELEAGATPVDTDANWAYFFQAFPPPPDFIEDMGKLTLDERRCVLCVHMICYVLDGTIGNSE